jgi:hypothetical protein
MPTSTARRPEGPFLLAGDQQLGEGAALRVAAELADPLGALEVGEHEDVEQFGARSRAERVQARSEAALELAVWFVARVRRRGRPRRLHGRATGELHGAAGAAASVSRPRMMGSA